MPTLKRLGHALELYDLSSLEYNACTLPGDTVGGDPTLRRLQVLIGLGISVGALYVALRGVHWREVGQAIREANYLLVAVVALLIITTLMLRAVRWRLMFHPLADIHLSHLFGSLNVGYLLNNILPLQVGELGRAYLLSELERISATRAFATVVVERILDVLTLCFFVLVLVPFIDLPSWARVPLVLLAVGVAGVAAVLVIASKRRKAAMWLVDFLLRLAPASFRPRLTEMVHNALDAFAVLAHPRLAPQLVAWSIVAWLLAGTAVYIGTEAFGLDVGFGAALFLLVATSFGFFVPSSPGAFGVYHAIVVTTLAGVFGADRNTALSYALVIHLVFYLPPVFIGTVFLWLHREIWQRTSFFDKLRSLRQEEAPAAAASPLD